jgi:hypothetical protein
MLRAITAAFAVMEAEEALSMLVDCYRLTEQPFPLILVMRSVLLAHNGVMPYNCARALLKASGREGRHK